MLLPMASAAKLKSSGEIVASISGTSSSGDNAHLVLSFNSANTGVIHSKAPTLLSMVEQPDRATLRSEELLQHRTHWTKWTPAQVSEWLQTLSVPDSVIQATFDEQVDGSMISCTEKSDWKELGATGMGSTKILAAILKLQAGEVAEPYAVLDAVQEDASTIDKHTQQEILIRHHIREISSARTATESMLLKHVKEIAAIDIEPAQPLMQAGVTSAHLPKLWQAINSELGPGIKLPRTFAFLYPNVMSIAAFIDKQSGLNVAPEASSICQLPLAPNVNPNRTAGCCIRAAASATPGGRNRPATLQQTLCAAFDPLCSIPCSRGFCQSVVEELYVQQGHFLDLVEHFDRSIFNLGKAETSEMDPTHRILLEVVLQASYGAGLRLEAPVAGSTGVFVGYGESEWPLVQQESNKAVSVFTAHSANGAAGAGRVSFLLGLNGPCIAIDTACSSSLVALHTAFQSLQLGTCNRAYTAGVSLLLHPSSWVAMCKLHALSGGGVCRTFDARADGYGRGEACSVFVVEPDDVCGETNHLLLGGTAVNQDGHRCRCSPWVAVSLIVAFRQHPQHVLFTTSAVLCASFTAFCFVQRKLHGTEWPGPAKCHSICDRPLLESDRLAQFRDSRHWHGTG